MGKAQPPVRRRQLDRLAHTLSAAREAVGCSRANAEPPRLPSEAHDASAVVMRLLGLVRK